MTVSEDDWRRQGQERYLNGLTFSRKEWTQSREDWDHDHCVFCSVKFMNGNDPEHVKEGYTDSEDYYWICDKCFSDFREEFDFRV